MQGSEFKPRIFQLWWLGIAVTFHQEGPYFESWHGVGMFPLLVWVSSRCSGSQNAGWLNQRRKWRMDGSELPARILNSVPVSGLLKDLLSWIMVSHITCTTK